MNGTGTQIHREVEFKFRVSEDFALEPVLISACAKGATLETDAVRHMSATYFDTTAGTLLRWGITLRFRSGGSDDGWHLKIPADNSAVSSGASVRSELHVDAPAGEPPAQFITVVGALLRDAELVPLATVDTLRTPYFLIHNGERVLEVVSDHVKVYRNEILVDSFHEIEVELLHDSGSALAKKLIARLTASGATPSSVSKASAGFGAIASAQPDVPQLPRPKKSALPYDLIRWALTQQIRSVIRAEVQSHLDLSAETLVHELHQTSQLLSILSAYLDHGDTLTMLEEINWLVTELSSPDHIHRDRTRAIASLDAIHDPLDRHEALLAIEAYCDRRGISAQSSATAAQRSDRYLYFFSDLMDFATVPPATELAFLPQKIWKNIAPEDLPAAARIFHTIFPKKSRKILSASSLGSSHSQILADREVLRKIAMDTHTTQAGAYALGLAVGQLSNNPAGMSGEGRE